MFMGISQKMAGAFSLEGKWLPVSGERSVSAGDTGEKGKKRGQKIIRRVKYR